MAGNCDSDERPGGRRHRARRRGDARRDAWRILEDASRLPGTAGHPDAELIEACASYAAVHRSVEVGRRSVTRAQRSRTELLDQLAASASRTLRGIARLRASTWEGHRARAAAFVIWDDDDLLGRAREGAVLEDEILAAIVADLVAP